ncbi:beta-N-acetylglucosaminidase domain-containing protein [Streptomyces sp. NPDC001292]|uniref:beta-N-acetylglucosaminidase domain-containing protein n=1 Tax=Streptomyces sp. NPDC001292 TaxID=3364558 RepID=UPI0036B12815
MQRSLRSALIGVTTALAMALVTVPARAVDDPQPTLPAGSELGDFAFGSSATQSSTFSGATAAAQAAGRGGDHTPAVSPVPHEISYGKEFPLPQRAVVVRDAESDPQAVATVAGTLRAAGVREVTQASAARPGAYPVYVGTRPASPAAEGLKPGGYVVSVSRHHTVLDGVDDAGTYYAAETFRQLFAGRKVFSATVRDWPDFATRGGQESFYGAKWSYEDELGEIRFLGAHKQNTFLYHPRIGDPHNAAQKWREPYSGARLEELRTIVAEAKKRHIRFIYRLGPEAPTAPGYGICHADPEELKLVLARFQQLYDIGVRDLSLGWDDVFDPISCAADRAKFGGDANPKAAAQAYVTNHVYTNFIRSHPGSRLITIPTEYWNATPSSYKKRYNELVEKDTSIYWTGPEVVSPQITNAQATAAKAAYGNRNMLIFDNYPVNDYAPNRLHLGPLTDRDAALTGTVEGITTNQMNQHAPSLIALFTAADFTWNTAAYDPEASWDRALRELGGKAYPALKVFAENSRSGPLKSTADAGRLKALVAAVWDKPGDADALAELEKYFGELVDAPGRIERDMGDPAFAAQAGPWLEKLGAYGEAGRTAVELLRADVAGDTAEVARLAHVLRRQRAALAAIPQQLTGRTADSFLSQVLNEVNLALHKPATQSSLGWGGVPERAVDGNTDGVFGQGSVTHTAEPSNQAWWQVDLKTAENLAEVRIYNRTDCCADRLRNYWVMTSEQEIRGQTIEEAKASPGVTAIRQSATAGTPSVIDLGNVKGRYLRIQLESGTNPLSLAEVEVYR